MATTTSPLFIIPTYHRVHYEPHFRSAILNALFVKKHNVAVACSIYKEAATHAEMVRLYATGGINLRHEKVKRTTSAVISELVETHWFTRDDAKELLLHVLNGCDVIDSAHAMTALAPHGSVGQTHWPFHLWAFDGDELVRTEVNERRLYPTVLLSYTPSILDVPDFPELYFQSSFGFFGYILADPYVLSRTLKLCRGLPHIFFYILPEMVTDRIYGCETCDGGYSDMVEESMHPLFDIRVGESIIEMERARDFRSGLQQMMSYVDTPISNAGDILPYMTIYYRVHIQEYVNSEGKVI